jgi:hypothetical protein
MLKLLATTLMLLPMVARAQVCGPDPVPAPAAAVGYTCEIFWDHFTDIATIDVNDTRAPGFKWYAHNNWEGLALGHTGWWLSGMPFPTPPGDMTIVSGGLQLRPSRNDQGVNMTTCATTGVANQYVGTAFPGAAYMQIEVTSITPQNGKLPGNNWWPAFWASPVEFMAAAPPGGVLTYFGELDIFEGINIPPSGTGRNIHWWSMDGTTLSDHPETYGSETFAVDGLTLAALLVPASANGGVGYVQGFVNDVRQTSFPGDRTWPPDDAHYDTNATQHLCLILTSGMNQSFVVRSVQVFGPPGGVEPPPVDRVGGRGRGFMMPR